jgi:hypothetical protein
LGVSKISRGGRRKGKRPLGRLTHRFEDNIKIHLEEIRCGDIEWIYVAQVRDR